MNWCNTFVKTRGEAMAGEDAINYRERGEALKAGRKPPKWRTIKENVVNLGLTNGNPSNESNIGHLSPLINTHGRWGLIHPHHLSGWKQDNTGDSSGGGGEEVNLPSCRYNTEMPEGNANNNNAARPLRREEEEERGLSFFLSFIYFLSAASLLAVSFVRSLGLWKENGSLSEWKGKKESYFFPLYISGRKKERSRRRF